MRIDPTLATNAPLPATLARFADAPPQERCRAVARDIWRTRGLRQRFLGGFQIADPVWDMLLDLYVAEARGGRVSMTDLALAAGVPRSTGVRWVNTLIGAGQLDAEEDVNDRRRVWVRLSADSRAALDAYFDAAAQAAPGRKDGPKLSLIAGKVD